MLYMKNTVSEAKAVGPLVNLGKSGSNMHSSVQLSRKGSVITSCRIPGNKNFQDLQYVTVTLESVCVASIWTK